MSEQELDKQDTGTATTICGVCGTPNVASDRFCAECGAPLSDPPGAPATAPLVVVAPPPPASSIAPSDRPRDTTLWIFAARPTAVVVAGLLLLLLAAALLAVGQLDHTGTIVMLSIVTAPLGLLVIATGLVRAVTGRG